MKQNDKCIHCNLLEKQHIYNKVCPKGFKSHSQQNGCSSTKVNNDLAECKRESDSKTIVRASEENAKKTLSADNGKDSCLNSSSSVPYTPLTKDKGIIIFVSPLLYYESDVVSALNGLRKDIDDFYDEEIRDDFYEFINKWFRLESEE